MRKRKPRAKGLTGPRSHAGQPTPEDTDLPVDRWDQLDGKLDEADFTDEGEPPITVDLVNQMLDPRTDPDTGVVDQRRPRRTKCARCYGQGRVPSRYPCSGRDCPDCGGKGYFETQPRQPRKDPPPMPDPGEIGFTIPEPAGQRSLPMPDLAAEKMQTVEPGDVDYVGPPPKQPDPRDLDHDQSDQQLLEQPAPRRRRQFVPPDSSDKPLRKRRRARKKRAPKASGRRPKPDNRTPPWELLSPEEI